MWAGVLSFVRRYDNHQGGAVGSWDPATQAGARVLWLHPEESTRTHITDAATPAPPGLTAFPAVALTAVPALTWPDAEDPKLERIWETSELAAPEPAMALPLEVEALYQALDATWGDRPHHQVGGHPEPVQGPVEWEAGQIERALRNADGTPDGRSGPAAEAGRGWHLLAQIDSDDEANMMWGDLGKLYFMIRPEDLQGRRFDQARFAWQCT